jgi:hypothetical protein
LELIEKEHLITTRKVKELLWGYECVRCDLDRGSVLLTDAECRDPLLKLASELAKDLHINPIFTLQVCWKQWPSTH